MKEGNGASEAADGSRALTNAVGTRDAGPMTSFDRRERYGPWRASATHTVTPQLVCRRKLEPRASHCQSVLVLWLPSRQCNWG